MAFLDIHVIQSVPPANINRDENGSPKTARYGGAERMRVSSQAWKRAARMKLEAAPSGFQVSQRSKRLPEILAERLAERVPLLRDRAPVIAAEVVSSVFGAKTTKKKKNDKERAATEYLLFLGIDQQEHLVDLLAGAGDRLADVNPEKLSEVVRDLALGTVVQQGHPPAVALFGRMIATEPRLNVDAACQVAHAISTHAVEAQFDFYTAVDDVDSDSDETGAGMMGSIEFNAATMYRYAAVDLRSLAANLGGDHVFAVDVAVEFARAFLLSMPTGKRATFANNTRPDAVLLSVRDDQPVSLVGAFEEPIRADILDDKITGYTVRSTAALLDYHAAQDDLYGTVPRAHVFSCSSSLVDGLHEITATVPAPVPVPAALDRARKELAEAIGA